MGGQDRRRLLRALGIFHLVAANSVCVLAEQSTGMVRDRLLQEASYLVFFNAGSGQARRDFGNSGFGTFLVVN
jgi:hypothetical protein